MVIAELTFAKCMTTAGVPICVSGRKLSSTRLMAEHCQAVSTFSEDDMDIRKGKNRSGRITASVLALLLGGLAIQVPAWAGSAQYSYDTLGRVIKVVYTDGSKTTTIVYSYDASGNRASVVTTQSP